MNYDPTRLWKDRRLSPDERARLVVQQLTDDEKWSWLSGPTAIPFPGGPAIPAGAVGSAAFYPAFERLGIPAIQQSDASLGVSTLGVSTLGDVRPGDSATALPSSPLLAASFDVDTARETGGPRGAAGPSEGLRRATGQRCQHRARGDRRPQFRVRLRRPAAHRSDRRPLGCRGYNSRAGTTTRTRSGWQAATTASGSASTHVTPPALRSASLGQTPWSSREETLSSHE